MFTYHVNACPQRESNPGTVHYLLGFANHLTSTVIIINYLNFYVCQIFENAKQHILFTYFNTKKIKNLNN